jgi:hypothetical protein
MGTVSPGHRHGGQRGVILGEMVDGQWLSVVDVHAAIGRTIQPADDRPDATRVIVLSDGIWRRVFGADPGVVGRTVELKGEAFEIIGVAPAAFRGVDMPNVLPTAAWVPLASAPLLFDRRDLRNRENRWLMAKGRLKPHVTWPRRRRVEPLTSSSMVRFRWKSRRAPIPHAPHGGARVAPIPAADLRMRKRRSDRWPARDDSDDRQTPCCSWRARTSPI